MGALSLLDIFDRRTKVTDVSRPIGAEPRIVSSTATKVVFDSSAPGEYVFGEEIRLEYGYQNRRTADDSVSTLRWEFKPTKGDISVVKGAVLVVVEFPYRYFWVGTAKFKTARKDQSHELANVTSQKELVRLLHDSNQDLFETRTGRLTAAIEEDQFRHFFAPLIVNEYKSLQNLFGIIPVRDGEAPNSDQVVNQILQSDYLQSFLRALKSGKPIGKEKLNYVPHAIRDDMDVLLWWSVKQALAGPGEKINKYADKPVAYLARDICEAHAFNITRNHLGPPHLGLNYLDTKEEGTRRLRDFLGTLAGI